MIYYKKIENDYIIGIETGNGETQITETEYNEILTAIHNRPTASSGYTYRLKTDLTWELCELPVEEETEDDEATAEEITTKLEEIL